MAFGVPGKINFQGRLADEHGNPATGSRTMAISIFDASQNGTKLYDEAIGQITLVRGIYSFQFGADGESAVGYGQTLSKAGDEGVRYTVTLDASPSPISSMEVDDGTHVWTAESPSGAPFSVSYDEETRALEVSYPDGSMPLPKSPVVRYRKVSAGIAAALRSTEELWLELSVDGVAQVPRQRLLAVPYAMEAARSAGAEVLLGASDENGVDVVRLGKRNGEVVEIALPESSGSMVMGDGAGAIPEAFREAIGVPSIEDVATKSDIPYVNVRDFGAIGDGIVDDTAAIQAAVSAHPHATIWFPIGTYRLSSAITGLGHGGRLLGENMHKTVLRQTSSEANGIEIRPDPTAVIQGLNLIIGPQVEELTLLGNGGQSQGNGIDVGTSGNTFDGDNAILRRVYLRGFAKGLSVRNVGQIRMYDSWIAYNGIGIHFHGRVQHSHQIYGTIIVRSSTYGVRMDAGAAGSFHLGDMGNNSIADVYVAGGSCSVFGGNWETSPRAVIVDMNASAQLFGIAFLRGGSSTPPILANPYSKITLYSCGQVGEAPMTHLVEKAASTAAVEYVGMGTLASNLYGSVANRQTLDSGQSVWLGNWPSRFHSTLPPLHPGHRGQPLQQVGAAAAAPDALFFQGQRRSGAMARLSMTPEVTANTYDELQTFKGPVVMENQAVRFTNLPVHEDNGEAMAAGLGVGRVYRTASGDLKVVYSP